MVDGKEIMSGNSVQMSDGCNNCTCNNGKLNCTGLSCSKYKSGKLLTKLSVNHINMLIFKKGEIPTYAKGVRALRGYFTPPTPL